MQQALHTCVCCGLRVDRCIIDAALPCSAQLCTTLRAHAQQSHTVLLYVRLLSPTCEIDWVLSLDHIMRVYGGKRQECTLDFFFLYVVHTYVRTRCTRVSYMRFTVSDPSPSMWKTWLIVLTYGTHCTCIQEHDPVVHETTQAKLSIHSVYSVIHVENQWVAFL